MGPGAKNDIYIKALASILHLGTLRGQIKDTEGTNIVSKTLYKFTIIHILPFETFCLKC